MRPIARTGLCGGQRLFGYLSVSANGQQLATSGWHDAVVKIFEVKNRPRFNPLIVHCASWQQIENYVKNIPEKAKIIQGPR